MITNPIPKDLESEFCRDIRELPEGENINRCIQCGTCSGSCPVSEVMQYSPRRIVAAIRAGMIREVLSSNAPWLCASCYSCAVRCPTKIPFTDIMYELKRLSVKHGLCPDKTTSAVMSKSFVEVVDKHGRNAEPKLIRKYYFRTNPLKMLGQMPLTIKLMSKRRLDFFPHTIKGIEGLQKMLAKAEENK